MKREFHKQQQLLLQPIVLPSEDVVNAVEDCLGQFIRPKTKILRFPPGCIPFHSFVSIIDRGKDSVARKPPSISDMGKPSSSLESKESSKYQDRTEDATSEKDEDPLESRHIHFLVILEEYQRRCDSEGKYLLAGEFKNHFESLRREEESRQLQQVKQKQVHDRQKIVEAHEKQFVEFNKSEKDLKSTFTAS